ncbi:MgtC/SapB family protein [Clostridium uliginosum]|uniref:Putative Mg2+ transporter-C (MgtC) family protein n=1 Tax=Clostridium uliginosum TaxID=119641 RepID=A0A1I1I3W1_9CLOT|nr:MgtC/SapB family protein [Clostridium uliginosum]SFC30997.1 putative Mg2+ transporter-C (MgtC) family protein [Clostridium uliginosum]
MPLQEIGLRLVLSILISGVIGYEREATNSPAGFRTHILVALGATIISLIQVEMVSQSIIMISTDEVLANSIKIDMGRLGAQVVSGIGFLGAGTIIHTKGSIKGLTTAASLWVVACVGLAIGFGYYSISILGGISIVLVLVSLKKFEKKFITNAGNYKVYMSYIDKSEAMKCIEQCIVTKGIKIINLEFYVEEDEESKKIKSCLLTIKIPKYFTLNEFLLQCGANQYINQIYEVKD